MTRLGIALFTALMATQTHAGDVVRVAATGSVGEVMDRLEGAVTGAGATVFARIDHGAGAESVGMEIGAAQLLVFGNPALGTPAMQQDPLAGLYLPLKVLAYEDAAGAVWLAYEEPSDTFGELAIPADAEVLAKMSGALGKLTSAAAGG
ncbi:hypothetical protein DEA8626_02297 [Defluviimonas aquaemixtae]|uniref:DUF302 domain-containing protein n=1 Tax=Albidovulum aquaemixtae TaxID=1542388 RepID=A0A2R8B802_9RHOB|nr:DUF302 domain-containing protein [Defluviimonas aquaemixtae]SPH18754.1 hypothetical protein DEA8626_02297 [Defluviimonas aquaemixtae]